MGIFGLMTYIREHPDKDQVAPRVDLIRLARERRAKDPTGEGKALLLCDYPGIVRALENAILEKRHPKVCGYYGCDTRLLGQQFELFIKSLHSVNIEPIFIGDGPAGADEENFKAKFEENKKRQIQKLERSEEWEKVVKSGGKARHNLPNRLSYPVCDYVLKELEVKCHISRCEADAVLIDRCKNSPNALGILSSDTDFAVAEGCHFLPLEFFDFQDALGFHKGDIRCGFESLPCRYTSHDVLAKCLHLRSEDMVWFAMLCGNDYTSPYASAVRQSFGIPKPGNAQQVAQWIGQGNTQQNSKVRGNEGFNVACQFSKDLYSGKLQCAGLTEMGTENLSSIFLSIERNIFWQQPVAEAPSLKLPLPYTVSQPIRSTVYALYGRTEVTEYGHRSYGPGGTFQVCGLENLSSIRKAVRSCEVVVRAAALHHFVSTPLHNLAEITCEKLQQNTPQPVDLPSDEQEVLRGIITMSTLAYLASVKEMKLEENEIQASLLAFAATSAGVHGDVDVGQPDPGHFLRAVSLSSTISVSLLALYYVAQLLDLAPKVSDIFCSSVFVPAFMAVMGHLPARIPALAPVVGAGGSPHLAELMGCIRTMDHFHGKPELTSPITLASAVRSYTALVGEVKALLQKQK